MNVILSHTSALEFWRLARAFRLPRPQPSRVCSPGTHLHQAEARELCARFGLSLPIHVLVRRDEKAPSTKNVVHHTRNGPLPYGSLAQIDDGIFILSPECCFTAAASFTTLPKHMCLGYELCGSYCSPATYDDVFKVDPLTSVEKLKAYAYRAEGMDGIEQTRRALRYVLPCSASRMETVLAMCLGLPYALGGYGLSQPQLNFRIDPGRREKALTSQNYYKCDLYWSKANLAVEYESNLCHTGGSRITKDSKRRDELSTLGVTVLTVTPGQLYNLDAFNQCALTIAKHLGERIRPRDAHFATRQMELRRAILPK